MPRKNIKTVGDYPLIAHTIKSAKKSKLISRLIVSTDDPEIKRVGLRLEEISCKPIERGDGSMHEPTFNIFRFRELDVPPSLEAEIEEALDQEFEIIEPNEDNGLLRKIRN